ncbi:unnamed protein product [Tilletia controversa]|nr:unnamed protein product [Tilletia controversa]
MAVLRTSSNGTEPVYLYLHEPLALKDGRAVLPELWFTDDADQLCGRGTVLRMRDGGDASAIVHVLPKQETDFAVKDVTTSSVLAERLRGRMLEGPDGSVMSTENPLRKLAKGKRMISVPLLVWEDDWRGTMGMGQYPHTSVLFSNALLDRTELDRRSAAVRFYATSAAAQPEELLEAFVEELNDLHAHPFWSWDCVEKDIVLVRPWMLAMLGDSVMLAKLSASIGVQGSRPCRICDWGGNQAFKHASDGIRAALQEGQLRTIEGIVEELGSQLDLAHDDDASGLMAHWTNTGIKDSATTEACTILLEENDKLKGKVARAPGQAANRLSDVEVQTKLGELRTALKAKQWYSPLLTITGFGGLEHTALDILHVASLGPGKYLAALTVDILGPAALDQLRVRLESLSTTAITDSEAYPAAAMIRRLETLNVKSLRSKWLPTEDDMQEPGIVIRSEAPLLYLTDLDIIGEGRGLPAFLPAERFHNGTAIVSQAGEKCKAGDFVSIHAQSTGTRREKVYDFTVGRLVGIFLSSGAANTPLVRLELFKIKEKSKYGMAGLVGDGTHALFEGKLLLQLLNAQHDCIFCECTNDPSGAEQLQERIRTGIRIPAVHHLGVQGRGHRRLCPRRPREGPPPTCNLISIVRRRAPGGPLSAEALHPRQGHDGIKLYISPDIYAFEPLRQSAENAGAVLSINHKTGDVATKLLLTVRERTMEIYGRAISKTISGKASMFGCTPADTMSSGKKTQSKGYLIALQPSSVLGLELGKRPIGPQRRHNMPTP